MINGLRINCFSIGLILLAVASLSSCITTKDLVSTAYQHQQKVEVELPSESKRLSVVLNIDSAILEPVTAIHERRMVLPLIIVNVWNLKKVVTIPDEWFRSRFSTYVHAFSDSINLYESIGERDLLVVIDNVPNEFYTQNKGWIVYPFAWSTLVLNTQDFAMDAQIIVRKNGSVVEKLDYSYSGAMETYPFKILEHGVSKKLWVGKYLNLRDEKIKYLAYSLCEQLMERRWED